MQEDQRKQLEALCCCCIREPRTSHPLEDDKKWITYPTKIGNSYIFYGFRDSYWPFHCHVGPDWPMVIFVFLSIICVNAVVIYLLSPLGWPFVLIAGLFGVILLYVYAATALSEPGIIFKIIDNGLINCPPTDVNILSRTNIQENHDIEEQKVNTSNIECSSCNLSRSITARHCHDCGVCVESLDHHCPWCGKCIGKKNLNFFYVFITLLQFQCYFLIGAACYFLIALFAYHGIPFGPSINRP